MPVAPGSAGGSRKCNTVLQGHPPAEPGATSRPVACSSRAALQSACRRAAVVGSLSALVVAGIVLQASNALAAPQYDSGGARSLTQGLDDLLGPPPAAAPDKQQPGEAKPPSFAPDQQLLNDLIQDNLDGAPPKPIVGEDIGQAKENPLVRVQQNMGHASQLIDRIDSRSKGLQQQIVTDLDELIAKMEKQCQGGQCNNPSQSQSQQSKRSQPKQSQSKEAQSKQAQSKPQQKPGQSKPSQSTAQSAAGDSTKRLGSGEGVSAEGRSREELMKEVWGHLPERLREQMLQGSSDEFLPQYREEIERYYQRLAEEEASRGR